MSLKGRARVSAAKSKAAVSMIVLTRSGFAKAWPVPKTLSISQRQNQRAIGSGMMGTRARKLLWMAGRPFGLGGTRTAPSSSSRVGAVQHRRIKMLPLDFSDRTIQAHRRARPVLQTLGGLQGMRGAAVVAEAGKLPLHGAAHRKVCWPPAHDPFAAVRQNALARQTLSSQAARLAGLLAALVVSVGEELRIKRRRKWWRCAVELKRDRSDKSGVHCLSRGASTHRGAVVARAMVTSFPGGLAASSVVEPFCRGGRYNQHGGMARKCISGQL